jgi:hypothetical protein
MTLCATYRPQRHLLKVGCPQKQHKNAESEQKTYHDKHNREINVGVNLLHDHVYHGMKHLFQLFFHVVALHGLQTLFNDFLSEHHS